MNNQRGTTAPGKVSGDVPDTPPPVPTKVNQETKQGTSTHSFPGFLSLAAAEDATYDRNIKPLNHLPPALLLDPQIGVLTVSCVLQVRPNPVMTQRCAS